MCNKRLYTSKIVLWYGINKELDTLDTIQCILDVSVIDHASDKRTQSDTKVKKVDNKTSYMIPDDSMTRSDSNLFFSRKVAFIP